MWTKAREISPGDVVILWLTRDSLEPLVITPGKVYNGRFGVYRHDDLVGVPYGSKVISKNGRGFVHILRPTPELWTLALPHRTQILYLADIAFITAWLDLKPGSIVIEAGTGSGSFSHSACRTIQPNGHLHSFEYHEERSKKARAEFQEHGMADLVTLKHRNVCKEGFGLEDAADAVFLDLPAPWDAIRHAKTAMKRRQIGRICCFSPCVEQVLRTVSALNDAGFTGMCQITMYETLMRPQEVVPITLPPIGQVIQRLRNAEVEGEARRLRQIAKANEKNKKRKLGDNGYDDAGMATASAGGNPCKKPKTDDEAGTSEGGEDGEIVHPVSVRQDVGDGSRTPVGGKPPPLPESSFHVTRPFTEVRGHTSYLTFAVLLPHDFVKWESGSAIQNAGTSNGLPGDTSQSAIDSQGMGDDPSWDAAALSLTVEV
ncbi:tRNA methyltransferase complex GCD14 subunit-domain-containing protein [Cantharellus anzutake]|uniref:tRNA methyltransferase complex GCD14 subunit-domain-containing protein n=1 Tax=Cantharellus anzutake TaxID=1750568 RepID=UPI001907E955|nr:tRNA methyltransferase complex GCD14 subunit-domain-containing protein [Cantharellus anzutake]KAF8340732.1 tRNA methyltransferase complex GCD14 subunit-domain-containing protein [Cantharellus anzutake]